MEEAPFMLVLSTSTSTDLRVRVEGKVFTEAEDVSATLIGRAQKGSEKLKWKQLSAPPC